VNSHLGHVGLNRLPVAEISRFDLPQARHDPDLSSLVLQSAQPGNKLFGLSDDVHATKVSIRIQFVNYYWAADRGLTPIVRSTVVLYEAGTDSPSVDQPMPDVDHDSIRMPRYPAVRLMF